MPVECEESIGEGSDLNSVDVDDVLSVLRCLCAMVDMFGGCLSRPRASCVVLPSSYHI